MKLHDFAIEDGWKDGRLDCTALLVGEEARVTTCLHRVVRKVAPSLLQCQACAACGSTLGYWSVSPEEANRASCEKRTRRREDAGCYVVPPRFLRFTLALRRPNDEVVAERELAVNLDAEGAVWPELCAGKPEAQRIVVLVLDALARATIVELVEAIAVVQEPNQERNQEQEGERP